MAAPATRIGRLSQYGTTRSKDVWKRLGKDSLWKRMTKNVIATTAIVVLCLIHRPNSVFGSAAYLATMTSVFGHPGRRLGQLVEALVLILVGGILGIGWSTLGLYLSSLVYGEDSAASYTIRGLFLTSALLFHGYLRSHTPRLFLLVLQFIIVCVTGLASTTTSLTLQFVTQFAYPLLMAVGVIFVVNICIFPEFSSDFLGAITIETLHDISSAMHNASEYFLEDSGAENRKVETTTATEGAKTKRNDETPPPEETKLSLKSITVAKARLRSKLGKCKAAQNECQFELAFSVLPPRDLRPICKEAMGKLIANVTSIIDSCESRAALLGDLMAVSDPPSPDANQTRPSGRDLTNVDGQATTDLERIKPQREIEFGDAEMFRSLLSRIRPPCIHLQGAVKQSVDIVQKCLAVSFGVVKLPSGDKPPSQISIESIDVQLDALKSAIRLFDADCTAALEDTTLPQEERGWEIDIMPREEIFLISSFILNVRQGTAYIETILEHSRQLILLHQERQGRRRIYLPRIRWSKWLYSGGEEDEALPAKGRKPAREGSNDYEDDEEADSPTRSEDNLVGKKKDDLEAAEGRDLGAESSSRRRTLTTGTKNRDKESSLPKTALASLITLSRGKLADFVDWVKESEDLAYALKLSIACMLVTFPALTPSLNYFYYVSRGTWATLQLVFVFEVAIGTSIQSFIIRAVGTTFGSLWGWAAFAAGGGDPYVCTAMITIGLVPAVYVQLGSKYPKAGMVGIIAMCIVALSTELPTVPGTATENFLKRWIAFMIGGVVAIIVEVVMLPLKARTRMVESIATSIKQISVMEACIAYGVETGEDLSGGFPPYVLTNFDRASRKAKTALSAAETFLPSCSVEPRLKGSFAGLAIIYREIIFVLHQIIDRMNNMILLRSAYGSGPLEHFNTELHPYRRNAAGAVTLVLYAVNEALTTKLPLPQFLPSARLAHLRLINKVRSVVQARVETRSNGDGSALARRPTIQRKYLAWNASSASRAEVIEYLEELTDLAKLLVGANEFRSGLLTRPTYREYTKKAGRGDNSKKDELARAETTGEVKELIGSGKSRKLRSPALSLEDDEAPASLMRIQSRRAEAGLRKRATNEA